MASASTSQLTPLPVYYSTPSTSSKKSKSPHYIYVRASNSSSKSLFIANLPADTTEDGLRTWFQPCGVVEEVTIGTKKASTGGHADEEEEDMDSDEDELSEMEESEDEQITQRQRGKKDRKAAKEKAMRPVVQPLPEIPTGPLSAKNRFGVVTFLDSSSLSRALALKSLTISASSAPTCISRYLSVYDALHPPLQTVKQHADSSMALFSHLATHAQKVQQKEIVDEDGFTLVVRGGKYGRGVGAGGAVGVAERGYKGEDQGKRGGNKGKGRMKGELKGFYRWQVREEKREDLASLRKKFSADQAKVKQLKADRKFKPY